MANKQVIEALQARVSELRNICKANGIPFFIILAPFENPEQVATSWNIPAMTNVAIKNVRMEYTLSVMEMPEPEKVEEEK